MGDLVTASNVDKSGDGEVLLRVDIIATAILSVLSALTFLLADSLDLIYAVVSAILFFGGAALMAIPAGLVVERCLAAKAPVPEGSAGPAEGWIEEATLIEALFGAGASVVEGDLGGWRGAHPPG